MGKIGWLALAALLLVGIAILSYRAGYTVGADMAQRDNRAEAAD